MPKQRCEGIVRDILKNCEKTYYMKLQVNQSAHTKTPGDFLLVSQYRTIIIECKECSGTSFAFNRYTQKEDLEKFHYSCSRTLGLIIICFWRKNRKKSIYYVFTVPELSELIKNSTKKSFNLNLFINKLNFEQFCVKIHEFIYK